MSAIQQLIRTISEQQNLSVILLPQRSTATASFITDLICAKSAYPQLLSELLNKLSQELYSFCVDSRKPGKTVFDCRASTSHQETLVVWTEISISDSETLTIDPNIFDQQANHLLSKLIPQPLSTDSVRQALSQMSGIQIQPFERREQPKLISNQITPVIGPDGVGKTTLINALRDNITVKSHYYRFKKLFRGSMGYQFNHFLTQLREGKDYDKNRHNDLHGLKMIKIAKRRYPRLLKQAKQANTHYFSDRFFHDYIIENLRITDRPTSLRENWRSLLADLPRTYWFIQLDAPSEVILSRKEELSAADINSYREACLQMYLQHPSPIFSYINTSQPLESCISHLQLDAKLAGIDAQKL